jgi:GTP diphosphokinase / guanosine-3',5'-bis(diphosphate) 3'-diphosphatase
MNDAKLLLEAASFAARKHSGQKRKGKEGEPYVNHPLEVANLLVSVGGIDDIDVLTAGLLHDTVEDTGTTRDEIESRFGKTAADIVMEVTDDKSLPKQERKRLQVEHAPHLSPGAKLVKLADKISNITDILESPPADWDDQRRREYVKWGEAVVAGLRGVNAGLERHFDKLVERAQKDLGGN